MTLTYFEKIFGPQGDVTVETFLFTYQKMGPVEFILDGQNHGRSMIVQDGFDRNSLAAIGLNTSIRHPFKTTNIK